MAKKPALKSRSSWDEEVARQAMELSPAMALGMALDRLDCTCWHGSAFLAVARQREEMWKARLKVRRMISNMNAQRGNDLSSSGEPGDVPRQAFPVDKAESALHIASEPLEYLANLKTILEDFGLVGCKRAREALAVGGGTALDAALQPNARGQPRSIELHITLQKLEGVFNRLASGVMNPRVIITEDAKRLVELGRWIARTRDEMWAVFETRGLYATAIAPTKLREDSGKSAGDYRPATWFPKRIVARLRQAASKKRKGKRVATRKIDGVVCYCVADARRWWPGDVPKEA